MPIIQLVDNDAHAWAIWKITEDEELLSAEVRPFESVPSATTHPSKRLEFLAGRAVIRQLAQAWKLPFAGVDKDQWGKPFLKGDNTPISLSHSFPYVAAGISRSGSSGIDLEQPKQKLLRVAPRVLGTAELRDAGEDIVKHCIYWCAKESLVKYHGKKDLNFIRNMQIEPFPRSEQGFLTGSIIADNDIVRVRLYYRVYDNFVLVVTNGQL